MHKNHNLTISKDAINSYINYGLPCFRLSLRSLYQWKKQTLPLDDLIGANSTYTFEKLCNFWHRGAKLSRDEKSSFSTGCRYLARITSYARRKSFTVNFRKNLRSSDAWSNLSAPFPAAFRRWNTKTKQRAARGHDDGPASTRIYQADAARTNSKAVGGLCTWLPDIHLAPTEGV